MSNNVGNMEPPKNNTLLDLTELNTIYGDSYRIYNMCKKFNNKKNNEYCNLLKYIKSNFGVALRMKTHNRFSDGEFYIGLRDNMKFNDSQMVENSNNLYKTKHIVKKIDGIISYINNIDNVNSILDIGTEDVYFLELLQQRTKCDKVLGLNIAEGFEHYNKDIYESNKIVFYDGINFPFGENEFDVVTLLAVLHHIQNIGKFIKNLSKITKYIYIKDNDMFTDTSYDLIEIQHELYEGVLYPNNRSPLFRITKEYVLNKFKKYGFVVIKESGYDIFTRPFTVLLGKINESRK